MTMSMSAARRKAASTASAFGRKRHYHATSIIGSSSSSDSDSDPNNPLTNGGTVEAVFIFHRHGDRAPNRYLGDPKYLQHESEHWYGRIPQPPGAVGSVHDELSRYFPPDIHASQNEGRYMDISREPFGFLTYRGTNQMREVGGGFRRRYERFGHRVGGGGDGDEATTISSNAGNEKNGDSKKNGYSLLEHWNVQAYSTNYLRTVMSVQCFLDGLIGKSCPARKSTMQQNRIYAGGGLKRYYKDMEKFERLANMGVSTWTTEDDMKNVEDGAVKVQVRDKEIDTLNAFDRHPQMMNGLVKDVIATEHFQRIDGAAKPLAETLSSYLPGLLGAPQAFGGTPSGVNWVHANDHFVCRNAHSVPLLAFSDYEGASRKEYKEAEEALESLAVPVCSHLSWRFREWYRCPRLLSAVAVPPFREMMDIMTKAATGLGTSDRRPFVLYSCHDVTLLALLYAIGADFLVSGEDCGGVGMQEEGEVYSDMNRKGTVREGTQQTSWRWWPAYSSTIAFELVRLDDSHSAGLDDNYVIRVILNGDSVGLIPRMSIEDEGLLKEQTLCSRQVFGRTSNDGESPKMMSLSDFDQVIRVLEEAGGHGSDLFSMEEDTPEMRAMDKIGVDGG